VDPQFGVGEIRRYVRDYLSLMVPKVCLITVVDPDLPEADRVPVQEFLDQEICQFQDEGVENVSGSLVEGENIADRLTRYGTDNGCDLIMMYTHGRSGLGSMSLSSVTHNVVNHSRLPVFTMRPEMELSQD
jgi:nucleotide-binding universal stress UspA family protein